MVDVGIHHIEVCLIDSFPVGSVAVVGDIRCRERHRSRQIGVYRLVATTFAHNDYRHIVVILGAFSVGSYIIACDITNRLIFHQIGAHNRSAAIIIGDIIDAAITHRFHIYESHLGEIIIHRHGERNHLTGSIERIRIYATYKS